MSECATNTTPELCDQLKAALRDMISHCEGGRLGTIGASQIYTPQIDTRTVERWKSLLAALSVAQPNPQTPETTKAWHAALAWCRHRGEYHDPHHAALANLAEKLERERDQARATANSFRQCAELTFGVMPFPRKFHWENNT